MRIANIFYKLFKNLFPSTKPKLEPSVTEIVHKEKEQANPVMMTSIPKPTVSEVPKQANSTGPKKKSIRTKRKK